MENIWPGAARGRSGRGAAPAGVRPGQTVGTGYSTRVQEIGRTSELTSCCTPQLLYAFPFIVEREKGHSKFLANILRNVVLILIKRKMK